MHFQMRIEKRWNNAHRRTSRSGLPDKSGHFLALVTVAIIAFAAVLPTFPTQSVTAQAKTPEDAVKGFLAGSHRSKSGEAMQYRLFVPPGYDADNNYPIVLWLHGSHRVEGRTIFRSSPAAIFAGSHIWTTPENQAEYHAFVLAPQVDVTKGWARPHTSTPPVAIRLALEILDTVEQKYSIDRTREYVVGQSMGGEGVWAALSIAPQRFAAAIALCGYGDAYMIPRVATSSSVDISGRARSGGTSRPRTNMGGGITQRQAARRSIRNIPSSATTCGTWRSEPDSVDGFHTI